MPTPFELTAEQAALRDGTARLARERLAPLARHDGLVNRELLAALADEGLLARVFPSGDAGATAGAAAAGQVAALDLCLLREGLAQGCTEAETTLALQGLGAYPILQHGSDATRARWIPEVAAGRAVASFALTEPDAGSDAAALSLAAERDGDGWRLSGTKLWISNAPQADVYTVFARTSGAGARGVSAFAVPADSPGLGGEPLAMLSPHPIGRLDFDDVPVGREALLGEEGSGFRVAMSTLDLFRPSVGAFAVGMGQAALELALAHVQRREAFGGPLARLQAVAHRLAELALVLEAARLLVYRAGALIDAGGERAAVTRASAMAKLFATEAAQQVVDGAVQLHGAAALRAGHPLEQLYRDVRAPRIYEGASEVQREIIARGLLRAGADAAT